MGGQMSTEADQTEQIEGEKPAISSKYIKELTVAIQAVSKGCQVAQTAAFSLISAESINKKDLSPVTVADFSVQATIIAEIDENSQLTTLLQKKRLKT